MPRLRGELRRASLSPSPRSQRSGREHPQADDADRRVCVIAPENAYSAFPPSSAARPTSPARQRGQLGQRQRECFAKPGRLPLLTLRRAIAGNPAAWHRAGGAASLPPIRNQEFSQELIRKTREAVSARANEGTGGRPSGSAGQTGRAESCDRGDRQIGREATGASTAGAPAHVHHPPRPAGPSYLPVACGRTRSPMLAHR